MSNTTLHVYEAITEIASLMADEGIGKDRKNAQQGYSFRGIDDVYNALSSKLAKSGLCILPRMIERSLLERETKNGGNLFYVTVKAEFDFVSSKDGSKHTVTTYGEAMDSGDKATNKAMSAAYKYAAFQTFCIPTEGDNDADATTHEVAPKPVAFTEEEKQGLINEINLSQNDYDVTKAYAKAAAEADKRGDAEARAEFKKNAQARKAALKQQTQSGE